MRASMHKRLNAREVSVFFAAQEIEVRNQFMRNARNTDIPAVRAISVKAAREANRALVGHLRDMGPKPDYSWPTAKRDLAARFGTRP